MRIALISTPTRTEVPNSYPPMGCLYIASYLKSLPNHYEVTIFDEAKNRNPLNTIISELSDYSPDIIGISGIITAYNYIVELVPHIKNAFPNIPIVVGGHITLGDEMPELLLKYGCTYVMTGWGELKWGALLAFLEGTGELDIIDGLSYLKDSKVVTLTNNDFPKIGLDDLPLPDYELIDMEYYTSVTLPLPERLKLMRYLDKTDKQLSEYKAFPVEPTRGCTDKCLFCVHEFGPYKGFKISKVDRVIENISILYHNYNVKVFYTGGELFIYNNKQAKEFVEKMTKNFPDAYFAISTRADRINPELVNILQHSNCYEIAFGFESGCNDMLNILLKKVTREQNIYAYKCVSNSPISINATFVVGTPGETYYTIDDTANAIIEANVISAGIFYTTPYPGSRLYSWTKENGYIPDTDAYLRKISNRNASVFTINYTAYPDIIARMMSTILNNAVEKNIRNSGLKSSRSHIEKIKYEYIVPFVYRSYFIIRRILGAFIKKYRIDTVPYELNALGTLCIEKDNVHK